MLGRLELLKWINAKVGTDYPKVEALGDGVAFLQLLDSLYPGVVPLTQVNFNASNAADNARNLRLLDAALNRTGNAQALPVEKMAKGSFLENLNFLKWCYRFATETRPSQTKETRAKRRRGKAKARKGKSRATAQSRAKPVQRRRGSSAPSSSDSDAGPQPYDGLRRRVEAQAAQLRRGAEPVRRSTSKPDVMKGELIPTRVDLVEEVAMRTPSPKRVPDGDRKLGLEHLGLTGRGANVPSPSARMRRNPQNAHLMYARGREVEDLIASLEMDLEQRIAQQHEMLVKVRTMQTERDFYYDKALHIESACATFPPCETSRVVQQILETETSIFKRRG